MRLLPPPPWKGPKIDCIFTWRNRQHYRGYFTSIFCFFKPRLKREGGKQKGPRKASECAQKGHRKDIEQVQRGEGTDSRVAQSGSREVQSAQSPKGLLQRTLLGGSKHSPQRVQRKPREAQGRAQERHKKGHRRHHKRESPETAPDPSGKQKLMAQGKREVCWPPQSLGHKHADRQVQRKQNRWVEGWVFEIRGACVLNTQLTQKMITVRHRDWTAPVRIRARLLRAKERSSENTLASSRRNKFERKDCC